MNGGGTDLVRLDVWSNQRLANEFGRASKRCPYGMRWIRRLCDANQLDWPDVKIGLFCVGRVGGMVAMYRSLDRRVQIGGYRKIPKECITMQLPLWKQAASSGPLHI